MFISTWNITITDEDLILASIRHEIQEIQEIMDSLDLSDADERDLYRKLETRRDALYEEAGWC